MKSSKETICKCIHRLKVKLNANVEIVAFNMQDKIPHPLHLHGHKFHVLDMALLNGTADLGYDGFVKLNIPKANPKRPPFKDTTVLPFPGYVRFRFRASNPGFWLFHCHYDWHLSIGKPGSSHEFNFHNLDIAGMALLVQVGEIHEMKPAPDDFPTCHNYLPSTLN